MNEIVKKYRATHPRCEWCRWYNHNAKGIFYGVPSYEECILKDRIIKFNRIQAKFCKYYEVKENEDEIQTN